MKLQTLPLFHGRNTKKFPLFTIDHKASYTATGSINGEMKITHNINTVLYKNHTNTVLCVRFDPTSDLLASSSDDNTIVIYKKIENVYKKIKQFETHTSDVSSLCWHNDFLVSAGYDGVVNVYNKNIFNVVYSVKAFDICYGVVVNEQHIICQSDKELRVYSFKLELVKTITQCFGGNLVEAFFARNSFNFGNKYLAVCLAHNNKANSVEVLDVNYEPRFSLIGHVAPAEVVCFYPYMLTKDGKCYFLLAVGSQDRSVSFWISTSPTPFLLVKNVFEQPVLDMFWRDCVLYVASYDGNVKTFVFSEDEIGVRAVDDKSVEEKVDVPLIYESVDDNNKEALMTKKEESDIEDVIKNNEQDENDTDLKHKDGQNDNSQNNNQKSINKQKVNGDDTICNLKNENGSNKYNQDEISMNEDSRNNNIQNTNDKNNQSVIDQNKNVQSINEMHEKDKDTTNNNKISKSSNSKSSCSKLSRAKRNGKLLRGPTEVKRITPILVEQKKAETKEIVVENTECLYIFPTGSAAHSVVKQDKAVERVYLQIAEFKILVENNERGRLTVLRAEEVFYTHTFDKIYFFKANRRFLVLVIKDATFDSLLVYVLETGLLHLPIITFQRIAYIDLKDHRLLITLGDSTVKVINLKSKASVIETKLPFTDNLKAVLLHDKYNIIACCVYGKYVYNHKMKLWFKKEHSFNTVLSKNTRIDFDESEEDETFEALEYDFRINELLGCKIKMVAIAEKMTRLSLTLTVFDEVLYNKFLYVYSSLKAFGENRKVVVLLQSMNENYVLQPYVIEMANLFKSQSSST